MCRKVIGRIVFFVCLCAAVSCTDRISFEDSPDYPEIFPDYVGVTVPEGTPNLSFRMKDGRRFRKETVRRGDTIFTTVSAWGKGSGKGVRYAPFPVYVSHDSIDSHLAYRLIEPGYESWHEMGIYQRELSSFREKAVVTNRINGMGCVNCHAFPAGDAGTMLFHARGAGGGTVFISGDSVGIVNLPDLENGKQGTYPSWHPSGRYVAFSSNQTRQCFIYGDRQPVEVYDTSSDIFLYDTQTGTVNEYPALNSEAVLETFPSWSSDGTRLYYCAADSVTRLPAERGKLRYRLMEIGFSEGKFTGEPQCIFQCDTLSVSFPRNFGRYVLMTVSSFGTFPIWHREADLALLDLVTGEFRKVDELNSGSAESYHSWSGNGRWVVFGSRRHDNRYTRLYIAHFDGEGHFDKPFLLPQKDVSHNDLRLKSYNIPEFVTSEIPDRRRQLEKLF